MLKFQRNRTKPELIRILFVTPLDLDCEQSFFCSKRNAHATPGSCFACDAGTHTGMFCVFPRDFPAKERLLAVYGQNIGTQSVQELFFVIGAFVELFTVMILFTFFWLRCTTRKKLYIRYYIGNGKIA